MEKSITFVQSDESMENALNVQIEVCEQLRKLGISLEVDLDKIEAMMEQQGNRISELKQRSRSLDQRIAKLKPVQDEINRRDVSMVREEREKNPDLQTGLIFPIIIATLWKEWLYAKAKK